jgi:hypothetical protein
MLVFIPEEVLPEFCWGGPDDCPEGTGAATVGAIELVRAGVKPTFKAIEG